MSTWGRVLLIFTSIATMPARKSKRSGPEIRTSRWALMPCVRKYDRYLFVQVDLIVELVAMRRVMSCAICAWFHQTGISRYSAIRSTISNRNARSFAFGVNMYRIPLLVRDGHRLPGG